MDNASDYGSELLGSTLGWLTLCFFCVSVSPQQTAGKIAFQIKNQITFIVTSPQHKCLGEWNSYERAPDSAEKQQTIYIWTDSAKKNNKQFTYGQTVQKNCTGAFTVLQTVQKKQQQFTYGQTVQKNNKQFTYGQTVQKNNSNLHMDRQCKKQTKKNNKNTSNLHMDSTYLQTVQKTMCKIHIHILSTLSVL